MEERKTLSPSPIVRAPASTSCTVSSAPGGKSPVRGRFLNLCEHSPERIRGLLMADEGNPGLVRERGNPGGKLAAVLNVLNNRDVGAA